MKYCNRCGASNEDNVRFCTNCGESFDRISQRPLYKKEIKQKKNRGLSITTIVFTIIALIPLIILIFSFKALANIDSINDSQEFANALSACLSFYVGDGLGFTFGLVAFILGIVNFIKNKESRRMSTILLIVDILIFAAIIVLIALNFFAYLSVIENIVNYYQHQYPQNF